MAGVQTLEEYFGDSEKQQRIIDGEKAMETIKLQDQVDEIVKLITKNPNIVELEQLKAATEAEIDMIDKMDNFEFNKGKIERDAEYKNRQTTIKKWTAPITEPVTQKKESVVGSVLRKISPKKNTNPTDKTQPNILVQAKQQRGISGQFIDEAITRLKGEGGKNIDKYDGQLPPKDDLFNKFTRIFNKADDNTYNREQFLQQLNDILTDIDTYRKDPNENNTITMDTLFTSDQLNIISQALKEEYNSKNFIQYVLKKSLLTIKGKKLAKPTIIWIGGPSASGKTFVTKQIITKLCSNNENESFKLNEYYNNILYEPNKNDHENKFITIDGSIERENSKIRNILINIALIKGWAGISDLENFISQIEGLNKIKNKINEEVSTLLGENNIEYNIIIPTTFVKSSYTPILTEEFKKIKIYAQNPNIYQIYAQVVGTNHEQFRAAVNFQGTNRAFIPSNKIPFYKNYLEFLEAIYKQNKIRLDNLDKIPKVDPLNPDSDKVESKAYPPEFFDRGVDKSNEALQVYTQYQKNGLYIESINDLQLVYQKVDNEKKPNSEIIPCTTGSPYQVKSWKGKLAAKTLSTIQIQQCNNNDNDNVQPNDIKVVSQRFLNQDPKPTDLNTYVRDKYPNEIKTYELLPYSILPEKCYRKIPSYFKSQSHRNALIRGLSELYGLNFNLMNQSCENLESDEIKAKITEILNEHNTIQTGKNFIDNANIQPIELSKQCLNDLISKTTDPALICKNEKIPLTPEIIAEIKNSINIKEYPFKIHYISQYSQQNQKNEYCIVKIPSNTPIDDFKTTIQKNMHSKCTLFTTEIEELRKKERQAKEAERLAKEAAAATEAKEKARLEQKAAEEKAEAERKAKEAAEAEAERKAKEEAERMEKEEAARKAKEEAERKTKEEADRIAKEELKKIIDNLQIVPDKLAEESELQKVNRLLELIKNESSQTNALNEINELYTNLGRCGTDINNAIFCLEKRKEQLESSAKVLTEAQEQKAKEAAKEKAERQAKEEAERQAKEEAERQAKERGELEEARQKQRLSQFPQITQQLQQKYRTYTAPLLLKTQPIKPQPTLPQLEKNEDTWSELYKKGTNEDAYISSLIQWLEGDNPANNDHALTQLKSLYKNGEQCSTTKKQAILCLKNRQQLLKVSKKTKIEFQEQPHEYPFDWGPNLNYNPQEPESKPEPETLLGGASGGNNTAISIEDIIKNQDNKYGNSIETIWKALGNRPILITSDKPSEKTSDEQLDEPSKFEITKAWERKFSLTESEFPSLQSLKKQLDDLMAKLDKTPISTQAQKECKALEIREFGHIEKLKTEIEKQKEEFTTKLEGEKSIQTNLEQQIQMIQRQTIENDTKIAQLTEEQGKIQSKLDSEQQKLAQKEQELARITKDLEENNTRLQQLTAQSQQEKQQNQDKIEQIRGDLMIKQQEKQQLETQLTKLREQIKQKEVKNADLLRQIDNSKKKKDNLEKTKLDLRSLEKKYNDLDRQNKTTLEQFKKQQTIIQQNNTIIKNKNSEINTLKQKTEQNKTLKQEIQKKQQEIDQLTNKNKQLRESNIKFLNTIGQHEDVFEEFVKEIQQKNTDIEKLSTQQHEWQKQIQTKQQTILENEARIKTLEQEKDTVRTQFEQEKDKFTQKEKELTANIGTSDETKQQIKQELTVIQHKMQELENQQKTKDAENNRLIEENNRFTEEIEKLKERNYDLRTLLIDANVRMEILLMRIESEKNIKQIQLESKTEDINALEAEIKELQHELEITTTESQQDKTKITHLEEQLKQKEKEYEQLKQETQTISNRINELNNEILSLKEKTAKLTDELQKTKETKPVDISPSVTQHLVTIRDFIKKYNTKLQELGKLVGINDELEPDSEIEHILIQLEQSYANIVKENHENKIEVNKWKGKCERINQYIKEYNII